MTRRDWLALGVLLVLPGVLLARYLFARPVPLIYPEASLGTDLPREVWPLWHFMAETLRQTGRLALWRPYLVSGSPIIGHPVAPILYLPNWLAFAVSLPLALNLLALLHLWWAAVGTYAVLRVHYGTRCEAALIGALLFGLSPKWIAHLSGGHWPMMAAVAWWPWAWFGFARYWSTRQLRWAVLLGLALAMQALNMGQIFAMCALWVAVCTFGYARRGALLNWLRDAALGWGVAVLVLVGLTAGQLWPLFELLPHTTRFALSRADASFGSLPPLLLLNALFPPELKFPEWFLYPGVGALLLASLSWAGGWSRRERWWAGGALVGLLLSLGTNSPLYPLLIRVVPGLSLFRVPSRWWLFALFALALLAAWGVEKRLAGPVAGGRRGRLALAAFGLLYLSATALKLAAADLLPFDVIPATVALLLAGALVAMKPARWTVAALVAVLFADVWWTAAGLIRPEPEAALTAHDGVAALLAEAAAGGERSFAPYGGLPETTLVTYHLAAADGLEDFQLAYYATLARRASGCDFAGYTMTVPPTRSSPDAVRACPEFEPDMTLLALLNVRYVILPAPADVPGATLALTDTHNQRYVYELDPGLGRAFGVGEGEVVSEAECLDRLVSIDPSHTALIESPLPFEDGNSPPVVISAEDAVNGQQITVRADDPGLLVRSETWAPGWRATVDGRAADVLRVDCALQGVWLEAGDQRVRFDYLPRSYAIGRWVSLLTALALAVWAGWLRYQARRAA